MFRNVLHGTFWSGLSTLANTAITLLVFLILAVQLGPRIIGLVSMALVFIALANRISGDEMADGLLRKPELEDIDRDSMFWLAVGIGALASMAIFLLAGPVARLFKEPEIAGLVRVLAVVPVLNAFSTVPKTLLRRRFDFRALALNSLAANLIAGVAAIGLALAGAGAWALVAFYVLLAFCMSAHFWIIRVHRPRLSFSRERAAPLVRTAYLMSNARLLAFVEENMPRILIGLIAGAHALGVFMMAWNINVALRRAIWTALNHVLASASAEIRRTSAIEGDGRLSTAVRRSIEIPGILALPMYLGFAAVAPLFFATYFSPEWHQTGIVARYLAIGFAASILYMVPLELLRGVGSARHLMFAWGVAAISVTVIVAALARHGVATTAAGVSVHFMLMAWCSLMLLSSGLDIDLTAPLLSWLRIALAALAMALLVHYALAALGERLDPKVALPLVIMLGAAVYLPLLRLLARPAFDAVHHIARRTAKHTGLV